MSCSYEVTANGELSIRPSSNKISFGDGDNITHIDNGEISFGTETSRTRITKGGIKKPKKDKTSAYQFASNELEIDVTDSDSTITINSNTRAIETIRFTNVQEGENGMCVIYYQQAFANDVTFSVSGGHVKSKDGNMGLTNIVGVYDIVHFYCVSDNTVLVELDSYATIGGTEIQIDELKDITASVSSNTTAIQNAVNDLVTLTTSVLTKAEKAYVDTQLGLKLDASGLSSASPITDLNTWKNDTVTPAITALQASETTTTTDIASLQTSVSNNATDIASLQTSVSTNATDIATLQSTVSTLSTSGGGGTTTVVSSGPAKIVPPETIEFGAFSNGTIDLHVNMNTLKFDTNANGTDLLAFAFDYSGITLTGVTDNPFQSQLSFSQVNGFRVALISLSNTPVLFSNVSDKVTLKLSYSELYGPEPFTLDGHYPMYYTSDTGRTPVTGTLGDAANEWSNGDTGTYYTDITHPDYTTGDYLEKTQHMLESVEILDSQNRSYGTNDSKRLYIKGVNGKFEINGVTQKELYLFENCEYTFISESFTTHPPYLTESATGGPSATEYSRGVTSEYKQYTTHPGTTTITHDTNPEYYYYTFTFTPGADTPDVLYYQCKNHLNMGGKINIVKQDTSSGIETYYVNAFISDGNGYYLSENNTSGLYTKLSFSGVEDPYNVFQNSTYTAPVDGVYKFELHAHSKSNTNNCMVRLVKGSTEIKPPIIIYSQDSNASKGYMIPLSKNETIEVEYQGHIWHNTSFNAYLVSTKKP